MLVLKNRISVLVPESDTEGNNYVDARFMDDYYDVNEVLGNAIESEFADVDFSSEEATGLLVRKSRTMNDRYFARLGRKVTWFYDLEFVTKEEIVSVVGDFIKNLFYVQGADIINFEINNNFIQVTRDEVEELDKVMTELL